MIDGSLKLTQRVSMAPLENATTSPARFWACALAGCPTATAAAKLRHSAAPAASAARDFGPLDFSQPGMADEWTLAQGIRSVTSPSDVLYGGAFGLTGFFADRAWINGDGVANTYDYQRAFEHDGLGDWLRASGITSASTNQSRWPKRLHSSI